MKSSEPHVPIVDFLHERLSADESERVAAHLKSCSECQELFTSYQRIFDSSREVGARDYKLSPAFSVAVMEQIEGLEPEQKNSEHQYQPSFLARWFKEHFATAATTVATCTLVLMLTITTMGKQANIAFSGVGSSIAMGKADEDYLSLRSADSASVSQPITTNHGREKDVSRSDRGNVSTGPAINQGITEASPPFLAKPEGIAYDEKRKQFARREAKLNGLADYAQTGSARYGSYDENKRLFVRNEPLSTFSIDVDTGSYTNVRNFLNRGQLPPTDAVRVEEFLNYFDYQFRGSFDGPFGLDYEIAPSPLEKDRYLLKLHLKAREAAKTTTGWNLVFLVDTSGSMSAENRIGLVKESLKMLARAMRPIDRIAIVAYAGSAGLVLDSTPGSERQTILSAIDRLSSGGSTNGAAGIDLAYQVAESHYQSGGVNRVILATDGDFNVGNYSFQGLVDLIEKKRRSGVTLTTIGVGEGNYNEQNLEQLANKGNGNYLYLDSIQEAERTLIGRLSSNMEVVAKDVKLQIEFNPQVVSAYRLIGYDNRRLAAEDFANDKVDAGEVGSGHTVTALYEVALTGTPFAAQLAEQSRYSASAGEAAPQDAGKIHEFGFLKLRYKEPEGSTSKELQFPIERTKLVEDPANTTADFRFASAVSYFGHMLRQSKYAGNYRFEDIYALASQAAKEASDEKKQEFLGLVKKAQSLTSARE